MVEIEVLIDHIKGARGKGFRDDFIKKGLLEKGYTESVIDNAFDNAGKPKRADSTSRVGKEYKSKIPITILVDDWLVYALEKKGEKDGLSLRSEIKKILKKNTPSDNIKMEVKRRTIIYKKRTEEQREKHNRENRKYRAKVIKERERKGKKLKIEGLAELPDYDEEDE